MFNRPEITAEWTVHAQVTISHPGQETRTGSENPSEDGNVRVVYSWHGHSGDDSGGAAATVLNPTTDRYGFNRGGMTFSVVPPCKSNQMSDSGYTSEKPASLHSQEKKCRSTCNITLTTPHAMQMVPSIPNRRAFSLRCPSSTISENVTADTIPKRANTFTTHFCTELPERRVEIRDAASQTTPIPTEADTEDERDRAESVRRKNRVYARRRHETDSVILGSRNSRSVSLHRNQELFCFFYLYFIYVLYFSDPSTIMPFSCIEIIIISRNIKFDCTNSDQIKRKINQFTSNRIANF